MVDTSINSKGKIDVKGKLSLDFLNLTSIIQPLLLHGESKSQR